ncbi:MAG: hypothetical protein C0617_02175 [Desulfuromonas sp.]|nr:MAG: hypothetical protein C0617_02175 [Desulfuromonas sp.]
MNSGKRGRLSEAEGEFSSAPNSSAQRREPAVACGEGGQGVGGALGSRGSGGQSPGRRRGRVPATRGRILCGDAPPENRKPASRPLAFAHIWSPPALQGLVN